MEDDKAHNQTMPQSPLGDGIKRPKTSRGRPTHSATKRVRNFQAPGSSPIHISSTESRLSEKIEIVDLEDKDGCNDVQTQQTGQHPPMTRPGARPLTLSELWDQVLPEEIIPGCIPNTSMTEKGRRVSKSRQTALVTVEERCTLNTDPTSLPSHLPTPAKEHCTSSLSHLPIPAQPGHGQLVYKVVEQRNSGSTVCGKTKDICVLVSGLSGSVGTSKRPMEHCTYGSGGVVDSSSRNTARLCSTPSGVKRQPTVNRSTTADQILADSCTVDSVNHSSLSVPVITMTQSTESRAYSSSSTSVDRESSIVVDSGTYKPSWQSSSTPAISTRRPLLNQTLVGGARAVKELAADKFTNASGFPHIEMTDFVSSLHLLLIHYKYTL